MSRMRRPGMWAGLAGLLLGIAVVALLPEGSLFFVPPPPDTSAQAATGERWACPMMDYIGNHPGNCPVCGMTMTRVTAGDLTAEQQRRMGVQLWTVSEGPARARVHAYGTVQYDDRTVQVVIPRVGGRVVRRHEAARHAGTLVQAGDPVIDLYSPEAFAAQGELAAAVQLGDESAVRALTQRFERWNLAEVARAILAGEAPVDTVTVRSPFAGRVVLAVGATETPAARLPKVGQEVMADEPLIQLVDPGAYMVIVHVPENRAHWLRVGQPARLASDDAGELPAIEADIAWLSPELDPELRAREVHLHLRDPQGRLLPGSLVSARFDAVLGPELYAADPLNRETWGTFPLVPKTAILSTGVRNVAWRVAARQPDGRLSFELAPVAIGPRFEDEAGNDVYVVRAGLQPGDEVATQGAFLIDSQAQLAGTPSLLFPVGAATPAAGHAH